MLTSEMVLQIENGVNSFSPAHHHRTRLLIVDDEADIRFALTRILDLEGYIADAAESGAEALELLATTGYDVMVLDMRMPEMDGLEVMQRVQQSYPELLIIILTGQATLESAIAATKTNNVVDYLLKPISNETFVKAVTSALQKRAERLRQQQLLKAAAQMLIAVQTPEITQDSAGVVGETTSWASKSQQVNGERFICAHPLTLDRQKRRVTLIDHPDQIIELTKGEASILTYFMLYPNQVLSCYDLVTNALEYETTEEGAENIIRPYIFRLRRKVEPVPKHPSLIRTVRRKGYRFVTTK